MPKDLKQQLLAPGHNPWFWLRVAFLAGLLALLDLMNPFDWYDSPEQSAGLFMQRFTSPLHDYKKSQDNVSVVLIDESYFAPNKPLWPIPSREFKFKILRNILKRKPKAIYLDLTYPDTPREVTNGSKNSREDALKELAIGLQKAAKNTPILIGDALTGIATETCTAQYASDFQCVQKNLHNQNILTPSFLEHAFSKPSKLQIVNVGYALKDSFYPLASKTLESIKGKGHLFASPALALHKIYAEEKEEASAIQNMWPSDASAMTQNRPRWLNAYQSVQLNNAYKTRAEDKQLSIKWGYYATENMRALNQMLNINHTKDCQFKPRPDGWGQRIMDSLYEYVDEFTIEQRVDKQIICPGITHFSAALLGDVRHMSKQTKEGQDDPDPVDHNKINRILDDAIKNKIVMVGVNLPQAKDITYSPLNGHIPGVFMHATALQNLIDYDIDYPREPKENIKRVFSGLFAMVMAYFLAILPTLVRHLHTRLLIIAGLIVPWLAILGLSYTNIPLAVAFLGVLMGFIESIEGQIEKIQTSNALHQATMKVQQQITQLAKKVWTAVCQTTSTAIKSVKRKIATVYTIMTNYYSKIKRALNKKSHSELSDFSSSMVLGSTKQKE